MVVAASLTAEVTTPMHTMSDNRNFGDANTAIATALTASRR
jgi:hypothetical protein